MRPSCAWILQLIISAYKDYSELIVDWMSFSIWKPSYGYEHVGLFVGGLVLAYMKPGKTTTKIHGSPDPGLCYIYSSWRDRFTQPTSNAYSHLLLLEVEVVPTGCVGGWADEGIIFHIASPNTAIYFFFCVHAELYYYVARPWPKPTVLKNRRIRLLIPWKTYFADQGSRLSEATYDA